MSDDVCVQECKQASFLSPVSISLTVSAVEIPEFPHPLTCEIYNYSIRALQQSGQEVSTLLLLDDTVFTDEVVQNPFIQNEPSGCHWLLLFTAEKGCNFLQFTFHETGQSPIYLAKLVHFLSFEVSLPAFLLRQVEGNLFRFQAFARDF